MALTFADVLEHPHNGITIGIGADTDSAEIVRGVATEAEEIWLFVEVNFTAAGAPGGNERFIATVFPRHTTGGNNFEDQAVRHVFQADVGQLYRWAVPLCSLPRFYVLNLFNDTGVATDALTAHAWIASLAITH